MIEEIVHLFILLKTLLYYTLEDDNEKINHIIFCKLKKFTKKIENVYYKEVLLEKMKKNLVSLVVLTTIYNYCRIGIL